MASKTVIRLISRNLHLMPSRSHATPPRWCLLRNRAKRPVPARLRKYLRKQVLVFFMMPSPSSSSFILAFCILAVVAITSLRAEPAEIVVSQENGTDNSTCWNEKTLPCRTLNYALQYVTNSTFVLLQSGRYSYSLTEHLNFSNRREIGLVGDQESSSVTVECHNGSLSFENSENITLRGILLHGCGGLHNSTAGDTFSEDRRAHIPFLSAVFFVYCKNIVIDNCSIVNSPGIGVNMYDVGGDVRIMHSRFESNRPIANSTGQDIATAGGGVYLEFTYKGGAFPFNENSSTLAEFDSNGSYTFYNCTFKDNYAPGQNFPTLTANRHGGQDIPFGRGGGLSIFLKGAAKNNLIQIINSNFENNHALWGGGLFIEYQDEVQNNTLEVINCAFRNNNATYAGGAVRIGTCAGSDSQELLANWMTYKDCTFERNGAILGGGVSHHGVLSHLKDTNDISHQILYVKCVWANNAATMGSAIGLATQPSVNGLLDLTGRGPMLTYRIVLDNCNVTNNAIVFTEDEQVIGQGAIYSYAVPVILKGNVNIEYNNNTAMVIENAALHVFGNVTFRNNVGGQGGALGLYGKAVIMLMPQSQLNFISNTAFERGGAIFVRDPGPPVLPFETTELDTRACFIAYNNSLSLGNVSEWQTKIVFRGNKVLTDGGGDSVYASTLSGCRQEGQPRINNKSLEWPNTVQYRDSDKSSKEQISTDPVEIKFSETDWEVSPSEIFDAFVQLIDEKDSAVLGVVKVTISDGHVKLDTASNLFLIQGDYPYINNLYLLGKEGSEFRIHANTVAGGVVQNISKKVTLRACHPGFEQNDDKTCSCMEKKEAGISSCAADSKHVFLRRGYWGGMVDDKFVTYPCPPNYCSNFTKNSTFEYNAETLCTSNRNGSSVLCGACKDGYSVNLGDEHCQKECGNSHLSLLLVFFIFTLLLVLVVLRIDLDIFTSYLNAWLYSYQIITFLVQEGQHLDPFITFIIGIANWRVKGIGTCLFHGMNNLQKLGINYILPSYVLLLLFILARVARCRPSCYINRNVPRAFCTLLVLCYTNVTMISWSILHYVPLNGRWVLYADGNIDFRKDWRTHLPYTILAFLWIVSFVLLLPLILLFTPWFLKGIPYLKTFRLFFDTFQHCFKDEYRWFAAYYFICRVCILFIALYIPFGPLKRSILEASSVIIVVTCLYLRPYKTGQNGNYNWLNTLDAVLLTNLCFVVIFSSGIVSDESHSTQDGLVKTVNVLAYVPLVYLVILICYYGWRKFVPKHSFQNDVEPEVGIGLSTDSVRPREE